MLIVLMQRLALSCVDSSSRREELLLRAYSRHQMLRILKVFFDQMRKKVSTSMLDVLKKEDFATILARVLSVSKDTKLGMLTASDYVEDVLWKKMEAIRKKKDSRFAAKRRKVARRSRMDIGTPRSFWHRKARVALCTEYKGDRWVHSQAGKKIMDDFGATLRHLFEEQGRCCKLCHVRMRTLQTRAWTNGSIDRIIPGTSGGRYVEDNVHLLCKGCNMVKFWYPLASAKILLGELGRLSLSQSDEWVESSVITSPRPIEAVEYTKIILPWCKHKLENTYYKSEKWQKAQKHKYTFKTSTLTLSEIVELVESNWLGEGFVKDTSGLKVALGLVGLDRIDSNQGYHIENVRLLLIGLNLLKSDSPDDKEVIGYLKHLRQSSFVKVEAEKAVSEGHSLPLYE
jgi:hypothetical protein